MLKSFVISALDKTGIATALSPIYAGKGVIFTGHRVLRDGSPTLLPGNAVTESQLQRIVQCIRRTGWDLVSLEEVPRLLSSRSRQRFACITLDDGFADNWHVAAPILAANKAPFSVFPVVGFIDRSTIPDQELLEWVLLNSEQIDLRLPGLPEIKRDVGTMAAKQQVFDEVMRLVWRRVPGLSQALEDHLRQRQQTVDAFMNETFMSWEQLRQLAHTERVTIGTHSLTHRALATLPVAEAGSELSKSREMLQRKLGVRIRCTAYPFGSPRECGVREYSLARDAGYDIGVTTRPGNIYARHRASLLALPRVTLSMVPHASSDAFIRTSLRGVRNAVLNRMRRTVP